MDFKHNLKDARKSLKLTQSQLAKAIKVHQNEIARWESGNRTPNLYTIIELCKALDVSADYLLGLSDY